MRWRRFGDASTSRRRRVSNALGSHRRRVGDATPMRHQQRVGVASATRRHRVVSGVASASSRRCAGGATRRHRLARQRACVLSARRRRRVGTRRVALSGWRGEKMMLKTCQSIWRVRQGVSDALVTRGRRIGVASAMRCRIGDASAMRSVGAGSVALVVWRSEEMMLKSRQAMGTVRQGVGDG